MLIKISPKYQITIPKMFRRHCSTGWISANMDGKVLMLRAVEIQEAKTDNEILEDLRKKLLG